MDLKDFSCVVNVRVHVLYGSSVCVCLTYFFLNVHFCTQLCAYETRVPVYDGRPGPHRCPQCLIAIKSQGNDCVKMALEELGAQLARPISVRVTADDSQFSQPIIWALIYAQRGHSPPLTNQKSECLRLVAIANEFSIPTQSQRNSSRVKRLKLVLARLRVRTRTGNKVYLLQHCGENNVLLR